MKTKRKRTMWAKLVPLGVNIIDRDGDMFGGITENDALSLHASLTRLLPRIKRQEARNILDSFSTENPNNSPHLDL